ncbi:MAG: YbdD/YjiX family protein [Gemmatimonadota bacterium]
MGARGGRGAAGQWFRVARELVTAVRRIVGMPDYEAHVAHLRACHPAAAIPTEREYFERFLLQKSTGSGSRCC